MNVVNLLNDIDCQRPILENNPQFLASTTDSWKNFFQESVLVQILPNLTLDYIVHVFFKPCILLNKIPSLPSFQKKFIPDGCMWL